MTRITLGGISMPRVPPAAIEAVASESAYLYLRISGIATLDIVAAVAIDEPEIAENIPQATTVDIASPPFLSPKKAYAALYSCFAIPPFSTRSPIKINNGKTESE